MKLFADKDDDTIFLRLLKDASTYYVRLHVYDDSSTEHTSELHSIADAETDIRVEMYSDDGYVDLFINDYKVERISGLDIDGKTPDYDLAFGNYNTDVGSGSIYIDTCGYNIGTLLPLFGAINTDFSLIAPEPSYELSSGNPLFRGGKQDFLLRAPEPDLERYTFEYYSSPRAPTATAETNDLSQFREVDTFTGIYEGTFTVTSTDPLNGNYSYETSVDGTKMAVGYLQDADRKRFSVSILLDPNGVTLDTSNYIQVMTDLSSYRVELAYDDGSHVVRLVAVLDDTSTSTTSWYDITDGSSNEILVTVKYSSGAGNDDGEMILTIDDTVKETLSDLDNDEQESSTHAFGTVLPTGSPGGAGETIIFDDCKVMPYMGVPYFTAKDTDFRLIAEKTDG